VLTFSSVHSYDFPRTSRYLAEKVKNTGRTPVYFGTLYDPLFGTMDYRSLNGRVSEDGEGVADAASPEKRLQTAEARIATESKRLLRLQVRDFVKWLQGQGALSAFRPFPRVLVRCTSLCISPPPVTCGAIIVTHRRMTESP